MKYKKISLLSIFILLLLLAMPKSLEATGSYQSEINKVFLQAIEENDCSKVKQIFDEEKEKHYVFLPVGKALEKAVKENNRELVELLIEYGKFNESLEGGLEDPLFITKTLVEEYQLDLNQKREKSRNFQLPLVVAAACSPPEVIKYMLDNRADPNICSALTVALKNEKYQNVNLLLSYGAIPRDADLDQFAYRGFTEVVKKCLGSGKFKSENTVEYTLINASTGGHLDLVKFLVEEIGADVNFIDEFGRTALSYASQTTFVDVVGYLLEHKANANLSPERPVLLEACKWNLDESSRGLIIEKLLDAGADANVREKKLRARLTPLIHSIINGDCTSVELLLRHGADVEKGDRYGRSPLVYAIDKGHNEIVKILLENGADVNKKYIDRRRKITPYQLASFLENEEAKELLLQYGASSS